MAAKPSTGTAQLEAHAAAYGVQLQPHLIQPQHFRLWAEHEPALRIFQRSMTQWRAAPGGLVGLDYVAVFRVAEVLAVRLDESVMDDLQTMEIHARDKINAKAKKA